MTKMESTNDSCSKKKEKIGWLHSLTRTKKKSKSALMDKIITSNGADSNQEAPVQELPELNEENKKQTNSEVIGRENDSDCSANGGDGSGDLATINIRKRKDENIFQRFRKRMSNHLSSLRRRQQQSGIVNSLLEDSLGASGTTDASKEFIHSPLKTRETAQSLNFSFDHDHELHSDDSAVAVRDETEMVPFTQDYKRFIVKKWLEGEVPNRVMYKASLEMLNQVWYWGEISRRDAQKQLTDKPTGSFLVRDSETKGCQFTLSFRVLNVTLHYRLEYRDNYWHFEELEYESIVEMIEDIIGRCVSDQFVCFVKVKTEMQPPFPVILKHPLSRYAKLPLLQHLCRRKIQKDLNTDEISKLPVPSKMLEYLKERHELAFQV